MEKIGRLITAMITPFDADGKVDYEQCKRLAQALLNSGSEGIVAAGTTGESPTLTHEEKLRLFKELRTVVNGKNALIAGTGNYSTAESIALTHEAEKIGVDACLLVVPYYNKPPQEGLYQHFKAIAESTSLPCILYNVPARTVTSMSSETIIRLSQIPNIVGVKEASGNLEEITKIIHGAREGFLVWSGNDSDTLPILSVGGYGIISVASHLVGLQIADMIDKFVTGKIYGAARLHRQLAAINKVLFVVSNPIPVKYAVDRAGFNAGEPRLPLVEPDEKTAALIRDTMKNYKIDLPVGVKA